MDGNNRTPKAGGRWDRRRGGEVKPVDGSARSHRDDFLFGEDYRRTKSLAF